MRESRLDSKWPGPFSPVLAGPIPRRVTADRLVLWLVGSAPLRLRLQLVDTQGGKPWFDQMLGYETLRILPLGEHAHIHFIDVTPEPNLPEDELVGYDLLIRDTNDWRPIHHWAPELLYPGETRPTLMVHSRIAGLLHGSCRKPHQPGGDGLVRADDWLAERVHSPRERPALMLLTGDQIYADDVAGPMLAAIQALIDRLGLYGEELENALVSDSEHLYTDERNFYHRESLLPHTRANAPLRDFFFGGVRKPIFTTSGAHNHLITLAEIVAMYLLVWSPVPWRGLNVNEPALGDNDQARYREEASIIDAFVEGLVQVRRVLAHLPAYMIFDDHDVTDDWNLTARWEEVARSHPFSRRIIGNALIGYLLFQGWGNRPEAFEGRIMEQLQCFLETPDARGHNTLIDRLLECEHWHFTLPTTPKVVVLDTRTQRWRSERNLSRPSGLMDWEALTELQQELLGNDAVIMVSAAPVFGVKFIETVQRAFAWCGKALLVDAENWMAHPGAANVILNIFRHRHTPRHFIILSGDVHYSFAYDIHLRFRKTTPTIWQITSSGMKNEFPPRLLNVFDHVDRWLYAPWSPLNWLTKRRWMHIQPRKPTGGAWGERLVNRSGVGLVRLDMTGQPVVIEQLAVDGRNYRFEREED